MRIAFAAAKLTVGLRPITKEVVKEHKMKRDEYGVNEGKSEEQKETDAREAACREFFKKEMKMTDDDIDSMSVERIFAPNKDDWDTLYVRLENEDDVGFLMSFKHYMRKGVQPSEKAEVINYIPRILFNRYKAITKIGNDERHKNGKNINFRVTFGETDFRLQFKNRGSRYWDTPVTLPEDLPGVEYQLPRGDRSPGEAPGRRPRNLDQENKKRERPSSSSSTGLTPPVKRNTSEESEELVVLENDIFRKNIN